MEWFHKCAEFFALAVTQDNKDKEHYDKELGALLSLGATLSFKQSGPFIKRWWMTPFLTLQDAQTLIRNSVDSKGSWRNQLWAFNQYFYNTSQNINNITDQGLLDTFTEEYLKQIDPITFRVEDYLEMENELHNGEKVSIILLRQAQRIILLKILDLIKKHQQYDSISGYPIQIFRELKNSKYFTPELLDGLMRRFGPEAWSHMKWFTDNMNMSDAEKIKSKMLNQDIITCYDINLFLMGNPPLNQHSLKQFYNRGDEEAKGLLCGLIYVWSEGKPEDYDIRCFMLSEDLTPMNEYYQHITWPRSFHAWRLSDLEPEISAIWKPIFHDFKIVPA